MQISDGALVTRVGRCVATNGLRQRVLRAAGSDLDRILQMTSFMDLKSTGAGYVAARKKILMLYTYISATIGVSALIVSRLLPEVQCCAAAA
jgi:hypothetical protein